MASLKVVSMKIVGVRKTKQITKAMNMVASAKLRGAQSRMERFRDYAEKFQAVIGDLTSKADGAANPLLEVRENKKTVGILLITSDRGLCGGFNANLISLALRLARKLKVEGKEVVFYCVGKKGWDTVRKLGFTISYRACDQMSDFDFTVAAKLGLSVMTAYLKGSIDEMILVYSNFKTVSKFVPEAMQLLPFVVVSNDEDKVLNKGSHSQSKVGEKTQTELDYSYEPKAEEFLAEVLPRYIGVQIYRTMLNTSTSEHAARMAAMDNATRNCDEMIETLTLIFNKTRQASITTDLIDIVSGAEALKG